MPKDEKEENFGCGNQLKTTMMAVKKKQERSNRGGEKPQRKVGQALDWI